MDIVKFYVTQPNTT